MTEPTSPLHIRDYRFFWLARFTSYAATTGMVVILGYQLYDYARADYGMSVKHAAFLLGVLGLVQFVPLLLLTPVAGLAADRFDRRNLAALSMSVDLLIALALALTTYAGVRSLPVLFAFGAVHGAVRVFLSPAMSAIAPNIVPPALIPRAIAFNSIAFQAGGMIGPAAAGFMYAGGESVPYFVAAALLVLGTVSTMLIRRVPPPADDRTVHPVRQMVDGFRYVWHERFLLGCVTLDLFAVLLGGATALLPVFARDILHVGPEGLGQMRAAPAIGAAVVAIWLGWKPLETNVGAKMLWAVAVFGAATAGFGLSRVFVVSMGCLIVLGAADMVSVFIRNSLVQLNTPDDVRGRVSSISNLAISASNELGEMQSGLAAAVLGATGAVVFGGAGAIVVTVLWAWIFPEIRRARTFAPQFRQREPEP